MIFSLYLDFILKIYLIIFFLILLFLSRNLVFQVMQTYFSYMLQHLVG